MRMIDVPEVEKKAYDPDRPISGLIQMQLVHLSAAEQTLPAKQRTGVNIAMLHTEAKAADYIGKVTAMLHHVAKAKKKTIRKSASKSAKTKKKQAGKTAKQGKPHKPRR